MISLVVPTINRSDFIIKYLFYLNSMNFNGQILLGDSSEKYHFEATSNFINNNKLSFSCEHIHCPNMFNFQAIRTVIPLIKFDYATFICDDDILVVDTLKKCAEFLDNNKEYSSVGGFSVCVVFENNSYEDVRYVVRYKVHEILQDKSYERVANITKKYSVVNYALTRTPEFKERWPINNKLNSTEIATEVLPCVTAAAQGKIKMLNDLYVVRQIHQRRILLPNILEQIKNQNWVSSLNFSIDYIAEKISEKDKIDSSISREYSRNAWNQFVKHGIKTKSKKKTKIKYYLNAIVSKVKCYFLLKRISSPISIHYINFKNIYNIITCSPNMLIEKKNSRILTRRK